MNNRRYIPYTEETLFSAMTCYGIPKFIGDGVSYSDILKCAGEIWYKAIEPTEFDDDYINIIYSALHDIRTEKFLQYSDGEQNES